MNQTAISIIGLSNRFKSTKAEAYLGSLHCESIARLQDRIGGLGKPSKMPGLAYGLPAKECKTGGKLRTCPGSVCSDCYALKGRYLFENVQAAQYRRLRCLEDLEQWSAAMVVLLSKKGRRISKENRFFRWHDSGDLQSPAHLAAIAWIAQELPEWKFWLPTKEYTWIHQYTARRFVPTNLVIRVSASWMNRRPNLPNPAVKGSGVDAGSAEIQEHDYLCPAPHQEGKCQNCRQCWNGLQEVIWYKRH